MPAKSAFRKSIREVLRRLTPLDIAEKSALLCDAIERLPEWKSARVVCLFAPLPDEPDVGLLKLEGRKVCYPRVRGSDLDLYFVDDPQAMERSRWNIREPVVGVNMPANHREINLILVPGVAFSRKGGRLGHGAGFYDRLLARTGWRARKMGICFDCQLVGELPVEAHDQEVDCIVTESGLIQ